MIRSTINWYQPAHELNVQIAFSLLLRRASQATFERGTALPAGGCLGKRAIIQAAEGVSVSHGIDFFSEEHGIPLKVIQPLMGFYSQSSNYCDATIML